MSKDKRKGELPKFTPNVPMVHRQFPFTQAKRHAPGSKDPVVNALHMEQVYKAFVEGTTEQAGTLLHMIEGLEQTGIIVHEFKQMKEFLTLLHDFGDQIPEINKNIGILHLKSDESKAKANELLNTEPAKIRDLIPGMNYMRSTAVAMSKRIDGVEPMLTTNDQEQALKIFWAEAKPIFAELFQADIRFREEFQRFETQNQNTFAAF